MFLKSISLEDWASDNSYTVVEQFICTICLYNERLFTDFDFTCLHIDLKQMKPDAIIHCYFTSSLYNNLFQ